MKRKLLSGLLAVSMMAGVLSGCGSSSSTDSTTAGTTGATDTTTEAESTSVDISEQVNLVMYLYGSEGVANQEILDALNEKLLESINATLEIKYIDWGDISTKYPLLWASGEKFDLAYVASNASVPYATLAKQDAVVDITDMLDVYAPTLKAFINEDAWTSMEVDGEIYGVPSTYSEFTAYGFVTRSDVLADAGLTAVTSIEDMETYMDAALEDGYVPLNGSSNLAMDLYRMMVATTSDWIDAPGIPSSEMYLVASTDDSGTVFSPVFTDEFEDFAVKMYEWAQKGYWSTDVLSASQDDKDNFYNGLSASYITHQPDWTGSYGTQLEKLAGIDTEFYCFAEENGKIIRKMGNENATAISATSDNPERALMLIEQLMTNEECYDLFQYGILGEQYVINDDGKTTTPDSYNAETDAGGFSAWAFRSDEFNIPSVTEDDRRYTLNEEWNEVAIDNPYAGFSFDSTDVSSELSAVASVDSQLGTQIMLGKVDDPVAAVEKYREQLTAAGIDDIIAAVNEQLAEFEASK